MFSSLDRFSLKGGIYIGGEYGECALRIGAKSVDYYDPISGSIGFQIGGQAKDIILKGRKVFQS